MEKLYSHLETEPIPIHQVLQHKCRQPLIEGRVDIGSSPPNGIMTPSFG